MTNQILTTLVIRIAGIFLFTKIFDHFGSYFFSVFNIASLSRIDELLNREPIDKFYITGTFLTVANIIVSLFLFIKAEWIATKLIKVDKEILTELTPKSLMKVILLSVSIIWFAMSVYLLPDFVEYCIELIKRIKGDEAQTTFRFSPAKYLLKTTISILIIFRIDKITNWILSK